jgi:hypothetical protein
MMAGLFPTIFFTAQLLLTTCGTIFSRALQ